MKSALIFFCRWNICLSTILSSRELLLSNGHTHWVLGITQTICHSIKVLICFPGHCAHNYILYTWVSISSSISIRPHTMAAIILTNMHFEYNNDPPALVKLYFQNNRKIIQVCIERPHLFVYFNCKSATI